MCGTNKVLPLNLNIQYGFITHDEIEIMVRHGEISEGNLLAYPNGYMQLFFSYALGEVDVTFEDLNEKLEEGSVMKKQGSG